ncbi:MAG: PadR family transcriptional regulator [Acidobacteria bacterium]|nr:PadR family transcriptional regulator [Acidobacteriota bacterium]
MRSLFTGTLNMLVLSALAVEPMHGYAIGRWIRDSSAGELGVEEGQLYPALQRLRGRGWVTAEWGTTDTGRRAKFYRLTPRGEQHLDTQVAKWRRYASAVLGILDSNGG